MMYDSMGQTVQSILLKGKGSIGELSMLVDTMASKHGHVDRGEYKKHHDCGDEEKLKGCSIG